MKKTMKKSTKGFLNNLITYAIVIIAFVFTQMALSKMIPGVTISRSLKGQLIPICVYIVMAVSLNLTVGISGELSLGHAGFMSVGAFSGIIMSGWLLNAFQMENETMRLVLAMLAGGVCAAIAGVLIGIPVLRLRGDYLAIVTLAFGEIIRNVMNCLYFAVSNGKLIINFNNPRIDGTLLYNGPAGAVRVGRIATFEAGFQLLFILRCRLALLAALRGILCALPDAQPFRHTEQQHARQAGYQQEIDTLFIILPRRLQPGDALFCGHWVFSSV